MSNFVWFEKAEQILYRKLQRGELSVSDPMSAVPSARTIGSARFLFRPTSGIHNDIPAPAALETMGPETASGVQAELPYPPESQGPTYHVVTYCEMRKL